MEDQRNTGNGGNRPGEPRRRPQRIPVDPRGETRQDRSVEVLLERLENTVEEARSVPFSSKCMMDREELLYMVRMIRESLPEELERARWVLQQNHQLINEARREAEAVIRDAEVQMAAMIDEHEVTLLIATAFGKREDVVYLFGRCELALLLPSASNY